MLDTTGNGIADSKNPSGYPHLVNRIYLKPDWNIKNPGGSGFPLNLKTETSYNQFLTHLEGNDYGRRCVFDMLGCYNSSAILDTDDAIPNWPDNVRQAFTPG